MKKKIVFLFFLVFISCQSQSSTEFYINPIDTATIIVPNLIDTTSQHILLIGDSMTGVFRWPLRDYCEYNGHKLSVVIWDASNTIWYNRHDTFAYYVNKIKPTYIIVLLGSNELFVPDISKRAKYIRGIVRQIGNIPFIWIGPPNWKKDTGINDLIRDIVGDKRFFPSYKITLYNSNFKRYKDGAHPLVSSARLWMDSVAVWIMKHSAYPIKMYKPHIRGTMKFKTYYMPPVQIDTIKSDTLKAINLKK